MAAKSIIKDFSAIKTMTLFWLWSGQLSMRLNKQQIDTLFLFSERHSFNSFYQKREPEKDC
jgi:hypothetical protein